MKMNFGDIGDIGDVDLNLENVWSPCPGLCRGDALELPRWPTKKGGKSLAGTRGLKMSPGKVGTRTGTHFSKLKILFQ